MEKIPDALERILEQGDFIAEGVLHLAQGGRVLYVAFLPFFDISRREVGKIIVVRDVSASQKDFHTTMAAIVGISLLVGGGVFFVFYGVLGRVEKDYRRQREVELRLSRVNEHHKKMIQIEKLSTMGLMTGEIAHQLNNPLVGVVNMAQLALRDVEDSARTKDLLVEIARAGKDCHAFVERLLTFTKITGFIRKPTDMKALLKETVALFRQSLPSPPPIHVRLPDEGPVLGVDPVLIRHALFNLLSNAEQANPPGGEIFIGLEQDRDKGGKARGWCISVRDRGPGLSDDVRAKLFTPFFTTRPEGTGLGLPVVQHIAIVHEGKITAENAREGGAVFALWLPQEPSDGKRRYDAQNTDC